MSAKIRFFNDTAKLILRYQKNCVSLHRLSDRTEGLKKAHFRLILRMVNLDTSQYDAGVRENDCSLELYSYAIRYSKWSNSNSLSASFKGSPSPTIRDRVKWMAPLSSYGFTFSGPRNKRLRPARIRDKQMDKVQIKADRMIEILNSLCKLNVDPSKGEGKYVIISNNGDVMISEQPSKELLIG